MSPFEAMPFSRFRAARPSDRLAALKQFYVDALGCTLLAEFSDHAGFDGLIVGNPGGHWQVEFLHQHGHVAVPVPSLEHLLVFYVDSREQLQARAARMEAAGHALAAPNNPYWAQYGATFVDPDGYHVVIAAMPTRTA